MSIYLSIPNYDYIRDWQSIKNMKYNSSGLTSIGCFQDRLLSATLLFTWFSLTLTILKTLQHQSHLHRKNLGSYSREKWVVKIIWRAIFLTLKPWNSCSNGCTPEIGRENSWSLQIVLIYLLLEINIPLCYLDPLWWEYDHCLKKATGYAIVHLEGGKQTIE